jgi:hypothetical protein
MSNQISYVEQSHLMLVYVDGRYNYHDINLSYRLIENYQK